ncbi:hypothetical protein GCM10025867_50720 (plasmid) [Frondihabitans sucicola]|uniref:Uncharacterized protein n=1 Tax=Frondihabitans sucicola TaxID=1268041 RepID=A0ABM8GWI7_9MICO|nr:hypothetical protein [Frondihabitans sucicola]BDZ52831.1 hypothetical protein GCM10025867_50720 [Frondihabitans sucicola]
MAHDPYIAALRDMHGMLHVMGIILFATFMLISYFRFRFAGFDWMATAINTMVGFVGAALVAWRTPLMPRSPSASGSWRAPQRPPLSSR